MGRTGRENAEAASPRERRRPEKGMSPVGNAAVIRGITAGSPSQSPAAVTEGHVRRAQGRGGGGDRDRDRHWDQRQARDI